MPKFGWTAFGTDYRSLVSVTDATNINTSVAISTGGAANYIIDPYDTNSGLTGTPSLTAPTGYGWRTADLQGQVVPAGTWSFTVRTDTSGVTLGTGAAFVRVNVYHSNILGEDVQLIGTATGNVDILTLLGGIQDHNLSFSASDVNLTDRVLVIEYWIIVTQPPLLPATAAFHTVSNVASVQIPTSPTTTYYLSPPRLHSMALGDSINVIEGSATFHSAVRPVPDGISVSDSLVTHVARSILDGISVTEEANSRFLSTIHDGVVVTESVVAKVIGRTIADDLTIGDSLSGKVSGLLMINQLTIIDGISKSVTRQANDGVSLNDSIVISINRIIEDGVILTESTDSHIAIVMTEGLSVEDEPVSSKNPPSSRLISDPLELSDSITPLHARPSIPSSPPSAGGGASENITTYPDSFFKENPLARIEIMDSVFLVDQKGEQIRDLKVGPGSDVTIITSFKNYQRMHQPYAHIVQILDEEGYTVHIDTTEGIIGAGKSASMTSTWKVSQSKEASSYRVVVFVWSGLANSEALSVPQFFTIK